MFDKKILL